MRSQQDYKVVDIIHDQATKPEPNASAEAGGSSGQLGHASDKQPQPQPQPQQQAPDSMKLVHDLEKRLKGCLHSVDDKGADDEANEKSEEKNRKQAYKELMEDLEREKKEHPFSAVMWIVNGCILLLFIIFLTTTRTLHVVHEHMLLNLRIHRWVAGVMVVVCGCPCIRFFTYIVSEPFVWVWKLKYRYLVFYARHLKRSVDVTLWFLLALWVWYTWFRPEIVKDKQGAVTLHVRMDDYREVLKIVVKQITRLLMALAIGAIIWTLKSAVFLKLLADLHFKDLTDRIRETILDLHGLLFVETGEQWSFLVGQGRLGNGNPPSQRVGSLPTLTKINTGSQEEAGVGGPAGQGQGQQPKAMSFWYNVSQLKKETVPIWILKRLTYTYMEHMKNKPRFLERLKDTNDDSKLLIAAKSMLEKVVGKDESCDITVAHLAKYGLQEEELKRVFTLFAPKDEEEEGNVDKITRDQFLRWAVRAVKDCLSLESTIESSKRIFWKLEVLMSSCVVVVTLVVWLLLTEIVSTAQIAILFAPFLSASFIFGESLKRSFDGIIFVFGMHPFDVGDRVMIENVEMKVKEMNILTTVFIKYETGVEVIYPNSDLTTKPIVNLDTAPDQPDTIQFTVPIKTPPELIRDLRFNIMKALDDDLSYTSSTVVAKKEISNEEITFIVYFKYLVSYLSAETRAKRRSRILCMIVKLRNEIVSAQGKASEEASQEEAYAILRFNIDPKMKLDKIEDLKIKIKETLRSNRSLRGDPQVLFTEMNKEKIIMDVRMRHTKDLSKEQLLRQINNAIEVKDEKSEQRNQNHVEVELHEKSDWDDNC